MQCAASECRLNLELARARGGSRQWTLRAKWTLAVLGVSVVPMVILGLVVLDIQRAGLARAEKELETAVVDEAASGVIGALDQASDVSARVLRVFADESLDVGARTRLIQDIVRRAPAVAGIAFFDDQRRFVDAVMSTDVRAPVAALAMPPGLDQRSGAGFRVVTTAGGVPEPRYEAPLQGAVHGFLIVALAADVIDKRLRDVSLVRFGAEERVFLVDESQHVLGGGSKRSLAIFDSASARATKSFATELLLTTEFDDGPVHEVGTIRTMPAQRWALVVERPADEAFAALTSARRAFFVSVAVLAALATLAGLLVVRRVLGPIGALMRLVQRYGRREFGARSDVTSGDELEALGSSLEHMADGLAASEDEIAKRARVETNLRRYMPAEAAEAAAKGESTLDLGGARRRVTVVFADVVAFTGFAEKASPESAVAFLNELFTILSAIVFRHGGMVDKFLGDCIMAVFRPTGADGDDVARALAAAEDMHAFVASNLPRWREAYAFDVELGIGVSTGEVLMGNLGSAERMEYTVIGDAVNVAARLEALARPRQTLATRAVVDACPGHSFTSLGEHALRGRAEPVEVFEVAP
jgi:adenylate cyclase